MNIGIIGSGEMGSCLAEKFVTLGHQVSMTNSRGPASLKQFAELTGAVARTIEEVIKNQQVIIVSVQTKNIPTLPKELFEQIPKDVAVIDTGNYYPGLRDGVIPSLDKSGVDSLWVQEQLGIPLVKVFNSILATSLKDLGRPSGEKDRIAMAVSGDDTNVKKMVFKLVDELGFDPFDMGNIVQSWRQQPGSSIYCRDINLTTLQRRVADMENIHLPDILAKRKTDEALMKTNYTAYLRSLQD